MDAICAHALTKTYRTTKRREGVRGALLDLVVRRRETLTAVDHLSVTVRPGERIGLIGPNGAGKSTTIKMFTGILRPSSGELSVGGHDPYRDRREHVRRIGVVFGQRTQLWWDLALIEALRLLARIYGVSDADFKTRLARFTELLDLGPLLHRQVRKLSLGERMRGDLAASLLHAPPLLFLDEPTIGLDVSVKARLRGFIRETTREEGTTLLLTTHDTADIEQLCERLWVIDHGQLLFDGSLDRFKATFGAFRRLVVDFSEPVPLAAVRSALGDMPAELREEWPGRVELSFALDGPSAPELLERLMRAAPIRDFTSAEPGIEELVRTFYESRRV